MAEEKMIFARLAALKPESILDVGCGTGEFTEELGAYAADVSGIDIDEERIKEAKKRSKKPNVRYHRADILAMSFPARMYEACVCRFSLHHMRDWRFAIDRMARMTRRLVVIAEPFFDLRSEEKRRTCEIAKIFLELHKEAGYSHFMYIEPGEILKHLRRKKLAVESRVIKSDDPITFDDYFGPYTRCIEYGARKKFWEDRIDQLRTEHQGEVFCDDDVLYAFCSKQRV